MVFYHLELLMPAIGQETNTTFLEQDIFDKVKYGQMKSEALCLVGDLDTFVTPVRKVGSPHFRSLSTIKQRRVGNSEVNPMHNSTVEMLLRNFQDKRIRLITYTYIDGVHDSEVIYDSRVSYRWWSDGEANQIGFVGGDYIRPDLCGRNLEIFSSNKKFRSIIIEVINTHTPEHETLRRLAELSERNYIVIFYFIPADRRKSQFNGFEILKKYVDLRAAFYLIDGDFFINGVPMVQVGREKREKDWYENLNSLFFAHPVAFKK